MLKAVRVVAKQQMPNYRKPSSFKIKETYPLPPYSSVVGLVHNMCGWTSYHSLRVSIQGCSASCVSDYAINYAFGSIPLDRAQLIVNDENGKQKGIARLPRSYELLTDVELLIHIIPDDQEEIDEISLALMDPPVYPSLGRYEDLLQIESVDIVEIGLAEDMVTLSYDAYIPIDRISSYANQNLTGTIYRLGKVFEYESAKGRSDRASKKSSRVWKESILARHVSSSIVINASDNIYYDKRHNEAILPA